MQADHAHPRIAQQGIDQAFHAVARFVAHGNQVSQRQAAPLHGQVQTDVAALRDEGDTAFQALPAVLVRP